MDEKQEKRLIEIDKKLDVIIKLLGRMAYPVPEIRRIVTFKKGSRSFNYIKGYNACDGKNSLTKIALIIGVKPSTLSPILKEWEEVGIIYKTGEGKYKHLFKIR